MGWPVCRVMRWGEDPCTLPILCPSSWGPVMMRPEMKVEGGNSAFAQCPLLCWLKRIMEQVEASPPRDWPGTRSPRRGGAGYSGAEWKRDSGKRSGKRGSTLLQWTTVVMQVTYATCIQHGTERQGMHCREQLQICP